MSNHNNRLATIHDLHTGKRMELPDPNRRNKIMAALAVTALGLISIGVDKLGIDGNSIAQALNQDLIDEVNSRVPAEGDACSVVNISTSNYVELASRFTSNWAEAESVREDMVSLRIDKNSYDGLDIGICEDAGGNSYVISVDNLPGSNS